MSNTATYLNRNQKEKLKRIAEKTESSQSKVLEVIIYAMPEDYIIQLVENYKNDLRLPVKPE